MPFTKLKTGCYARGAFFGRNYFRKVLADLVSKNIGSDYAKFLAAKLNDSTKEGSGEEQSAINLLNEKCCGKDVKFVEQNGDLHLIEVTVEDINNFEEII